MSSPRLQKMFTTNFKGKKMKKLSREQINSLREKLFKASVWACEGEGEENPHSAYKTVPEALKRPPLASYEKDCE